MMKTTLRRVATAVLAIVLAGNTCAYGQSFLKKLGKALDKVAAATAPANSSNVATAGSKSVIIPNVDFTLKSCVRWGTDVRVVFQMTNNNSSDLVLWFGYDGSEKCVASLQGGRTLNCYVAQFGTDRAMDGMMGSVPFPAGVPVNGTFIVEGVPETDTQLASFIMGGKWNLKDEYGSKEFVYSCRQAIPITTVKNTNKDNVKCPLPNINVNFLGIKRAGANAVATYTLTAQQEMQLGEVNKGLAYDTEGNSYDFNITYAGKPASYSLGLPGGVPVKGVMTIYKVPQSIKQFSLLRMQLADGKMIEVRNEPVQ